MIQYFMVFHSPGTYSEREFNGGVLMEYFKKTFGIYLLVVIGAVLSAVLLSQISTESSIPTFHRSEQSIIVIDAGHGGEDGGAVSVTGQKESELNLEIALRLRDLLGFLGVQTRMIRTEDVSVYTEGETIAQKKVSDIRQRVRLVEETPGALLVSIHQNHFSEAKYRGAQVFYAKGSEGLAETMQAAIASYVDPNNHRQCKAIQDVYLFEHITCEAVLVECGFLSNPAEELLLRDEQYQKKLAVAIGCCLVDYLEDCNEV